MGDEMVKGELCLYILFIVVAFIGCFCSILLCWIIYDMKIWNDFNKLIFSMTAFDTLYFICFANPNVLIDYRHSEVGYSIGIVMYVFSLIGGISSYIISSYISFSVVHLLLFVEVFDIKKWKYLLLSLIIIPNIIWVIITVIGYNSPGGPNFLLLDVGYKLTSIIRLTCVAFNILSYALTLLKVREIYATAASQNRDTNRQENAIITIVDRLKWYPVLQVISRSFPTIYAFAFPNNADVDDAGYNVNDPLRYSFNILAVVCVIVSPVGFLIVYLNMKPASLNHIKKRLGFKVYDNELSKSFLTHPHYNVMGFPNYTQNANSHLYLPQASISITTPLHSQVSNNTSSSFSSLKSDNFDTTGDKCNWKLFDDDDLLRVISDESSLQSSMKSNITSSSKNSSLNSTNQQ